MHDADTTAGLLRRYRTHTAALLAALAWWGFGNLYEAVVLLPLLAGLPPGSLGGTASPGDPVFYFAPAAVAAPVLALALALRLRRDRADRVLPGSTRAAVLAAALVAAGIALTVPMVGLVVPGLRDAAASREELLAAVVLWESGNAVRLLLVAGAASAVLRWRLRLTEAALGPAARTAERR
ncbi:hypothetical protein [Allonocardiopsis opalescens]|uniref:Uncharacterized protein n=1 Tax=Allonocardiopsis opalescens TaxID=1144618 RepID=A0A2T0QEW5_9ACTN|nr:hypothetical protein [Allonocardiopsis opalescens]PRY02477.1 hypothetical protein CLV72_1011079 [Allonocardiopsis opalescens]